MHFNWCGNIPLLWREYLALAVKGLTSSPKISDMTNSDVSKLFLLHNDAKVGEKCRLADFGSV